METFEIIFGLLFLVAFLLLFLFWKSPSKVKYLKKQRKKIKQ